MCAHSPQTHHARVQPTRNKTQNHKSQGKKKKRKEKYNRTHTHITHTHTSMNTSRRFDLKAVGRLRLLNTLSAVAVSVTGGVNTHTSPSPPDRSAPVMCSKCSPNCPRENHNSRDSELLTGTTLTERGFSEMTEVSRFFFSFFFFFSSPTSQQVKSQQKHVFHQFVLHCVDDDMKQMSALWIAALTPFESYALQNKPLWVITF